MYLKKKKVARNELPAPIKPQFDTQHAICKTYFFTLYGIYFEGRKHLIVCISIISARGCMKIFQLKVTHLKHTSTGCPKIAIGGGKNKTKLTWTSATKYRKVLLGVA